jgi:hypothetical protein
MRPDAANARPAAEFIRRFRINDLDERGVLAFDDRDALHPLNFAGRAAIVALACTPYVVVREHKLVAAICAGSSLLAHKVPSVVS